MTLSLHEQLQRLARLDVGEAFFSAPLARYCTWRIGGPADLLLEPASIPQIQTIARFAHQEGIPLIVLGQGSNLLFADEGFRGIVLHLGAPFSRVHVEGTRLHAAGGAWVPGIARLAQRNGLGGVEHIIGIPGTIGGLVVMNGGSRRRGIGENIRQVEIVTRKGELKTLNAADCHFGYRSSALQRSGDIVVQVELECSRCAPHLIRKEMLADLRERRTKFPLKLPNCGSVFLSTAEMHATVGPPGRIIENSGLKGLRVGGAEVSRRHANFIVNSAGATAADVLSLIALIRSTVREKIGFDLNCEVRYVSPEGRIVPAHQALPRPPLA